MRTPRKKNTALREELRRQWGVIFGNHRYWFHLVIWSLVIIYCANSYSSSAGDKFNAGIRVGDDGKITVMNMPMTAAGIAVASLIAAAMVYFFLLPVIAYARYRQRKRYLLIGVSINAFVWLCVLFTASLMVGYLKETEGLPGIERASFVVFIAVFSLIISAYFFSIYYFIDLYDQQKNLARFQQVFTEKLQAETTFLKTQINPHFLFNTLNNIYSLTLSKSADAARITTQLRELISYMVNECAQDLVLLDREVAFLHNYIALEQLRNKEGHARIELSVNGDTTGLEIAPLLLINFIENAFKHGVKGGIEQSFVTVALEVNNHQLTMQVKNSKPAQPGKPLAVNEGGGIGIGNVKRRLAILYPDRHRLRIRQSAADYNVRLTINL